MLNPIFTIPVNDFIAGETQEWAFYLYTINGAPFDVSNCKVAFSLINYLNPNGAPLFSKEYDPQLPVKANAPIRILIGGEDDKDIFNVVMVRFFPQDTVTLHGRYICQLSITDPFGNNEVPAHGVVNIVRNINKNFIKAKE